MFMSIDKVNKGEVMKKVFLVSMVSLGIWSCGGGNSDGWSSAEQQAYLNGCMSSGVQTAEKEEICKCVLRLLWLKKYQTQAIGMRSSKYRYSGLAKVKLLIIILWFCLMNKVKSKFDS